MLLFAAALVGLLVLLAWRDTNKPVLRTVTIPVEGLERPYRFLHVTDLHGSRFGEAQSSLTTLLRGRSYDAVAFTGDATLARGTDTGPAIELVEAVRHQGPMLFVPGNHDDSAVGPALVSAGATDLSVAKQFSVGGPKGVTFLAVSEIGRVPQASGTVVVLEHVPLSSEQLRAAGAQGVDAVLSGHTHGGNMRLPLLGALIAPPIGDSADWTLLPERKGLHVEGIKKVSGVWVHISRGLGVGQKANLPEWLYFRFGVRAEMTEVLVVPSGR